MVSSGAVILLLRGSAPSHQPLMLKTVLFSPAARWLSLSLQRCGVERFFVVSEEEWLSSAALCFPEGAELVSAQDELLNEKLMTFAASCDGKIITITEPVWLSSSGCEELVNDEFLTPAGDAMGVYRVEAEFLAQGGMDTLNYGEYYSPINDPEIQLLPLGSSEDLLKVRQLGLQDNLYRLMKDGVDIIDPNTTYVEPGAWIAPGSTIMPNTILRGQVLAGEDCVLGPNSMLTECTLGAHCSVNASQVSFISLPDGTHVGPFENVRP
jgi:bifunctional UDP-N-acetylglucosamine pyrophosphorylase/glucosamine-1-phosphate N-acetyltransferase